MRVASYFAAAGIELLPPTSGAVGRLALTGAFSLAGQRGIVVKPKRGVISDKYLNVLGRDADLRLVAVDASPGVEFFGRRTATEKLKPLSALPLARTDNFVGREVLEEVLRRAGCVDSSRRSSTTNLRRTWLLLTAKIADERCSGRIFASLDPHELKGSKARREFAARASKLLPARLRSEASRALAQECVCEAACLIAPLRLNPRVESEYEVVLEAIGTASPVRGTNHGPVSSRVARVARALVGVREPRAIGVVSPVADCLLVAAVNARKSVARLPGVDAALSQLLVELLPGVTVLTHTSEFPSDVDILLVSLPFGGKVTDRDRLRKSEIGRTSGSVPRDQAIEVVSLEDAVRTAPPGAWLVAVVPESLLANAGHAEARRWLLARTRVVAVIDFARPVFAGTSVRSSLLLLENAQPVGDYGIFMCELGEKDLADASISERLKSAFSEFVEAEKLKGRVP